MGRLMGMGNPFVNRGKVVRPELLLVRPRETREALRLIEEGQNCSLVGPSKSGKTALLHYLLRPGMLDHTPGPGRARRVIYLSFEGLNAVTQEQFFGLLAGLILSQSFTPPALLWPLRDAPGGLTALELKHLLDQLQATGECLIVLLDELGEATRNPAFDAGFFAALRSLASRPEVCFVTASDRPLNELRFAGEEIGSPFANLFMTVRLRPMSFDEVWDWAHALALRQGVDLIPAREFIAQLAGSDLYHFQLVSHAVFEYLNDGSTFTEVVARDIADHVYEQALPVLSLAWERLSGDQQREALAAVAGESSPAPVEGLTVAREGKVVPVNGQVTRFLTDRERELPASLRQAFSDPAAESALALRFVRLLLRVAEARDQYAAAHGERTGEFAEAMARALGLPETQAHAVKLAGRLHDVGHVGISDTILMKPGDLSDEELEVMQTHPLISAQLLDVLGFEGTVRLAVRYHHERLDGSGYPEGLVGEEIPLTARIVAAADVFAAMTTGRPYRAARSEEEALAELATGAGTRYDARVVQALAQLVARGGRESS